MDERMKESISALMDDEASEIELQRILSRSDSDELSEQWSRYHQIRDVIQGEQRSVASIDVRAGVMAAIADELPGESSEDTVSMVAGSQRPAANGPAEQARESAETVDEASVAANRSWFFGGGVAVAASVMLAAVLNFDYLNKDAATRASETTLVAQVEAEAELVQNTELNAEQQQRFTQYLLRHSESSALRTNYGVMPLVRVASVNSVGI